MIPPDFRLHQPCCRAGTRRRAGFYRAPLSDARLPLASDDRCNPAVNDGRMGHRDFMSVSLWSKLSTRHNSIDDAIGHRIGSQEAAIIP